MTQTTTENAALYAAQDASHQSDDSQRNVKRGLRTPNWRRNLMACAGLFLISLLPSAANAAVKTWDGGGADSNWKTAANWDLDVAPVAGDSLVFAGTNKLTPVNDFDSGTQFNGISFSTGAGAFVLTGNAITLGGDLTNSATATETIRFPMTLIQNTNASVGTGGNLTLNVGTTAPTFTATITGGAVTSIAFTAGAGLSPNATFPLTFTFPTGAGGTPATATVTTGPTGVVTGVTVTNGGSGYTAAPIVVLPILTQDATPRSLTKVGAGTLTLGAFNTFTGGTTVNSGTLVLSAGGGIGAIRGQLDINAGTTVSLTTVDNALGFTVTAGTNPTVKVETVNIDGGTLNTTANNNAVRTNIFLKNGGTLGGNGAFNFESPFALTTIPSATTATLGNVLLRSPSVSFNVPLGTTPSGIDLNATGVINGNPLTSGLNKLGTGTMVLGGNNLYTGTTTVTEGILQLSAANRLADASSMNLNGGTFNTAGFSETVSALSLSANSTLNFGNGASTLSYSGIGTFTSGQTLTLTNYTPGPDHLFIGNTAALTTAQLAQISFGGATTAQQLSTGEIVPTGSVTEVFWTGDQDNKWNTNNGGNTNWSSDPTTNIDLGRLPGATDNVNFAIPNAQNLPATVLGADFSIRTLIVNANATTGVTIGGTNNLTISSAGISIASGAGATTINTTGQVILGGDQIWANNSANAFTVSSTVAGTGFGINKTGTGPLTLSGANTFTGTTTISAGNLTASGGSALPDSGAVVTSNIASISLILTSNETVGSLSGGGTTGGGTNLGANTLTLNNGASTTSSYAGIISGTGSLIKAGTGTQTLSAANTLTGSFTINSGTLTLSGLNGTAGPTLTTVNNGGTLNLNNGGATGVIRGTLNINAGAVVNLNTVDSLGYTSAAVAVTTVNIIGNGILNNTINGNNGYIANFNLTGATVAQTVTANGINGINFNTGAGITTLASSTTSVISTPVVLRANPIIFTVAQGTTSSGIDLSITGAITQNGSGFGFTKAGPGTLLISGSSTTNPATGPTTISAGALQLGAANRLADASAMVLSGGTFATGGFSETVGALTLTDATASIIDLGNGASVLRFIPVSPATALSGAGTVNVLNYTSGSDQLFIGNSAALTSAQLAQISFTIGGNTVSAFQRSTGEVVPALASTATTGARISEFRLSGPSGDNDEFVEIYNTTSGPLDLSGWSVVAGSVTATIPLGMTPVPGYGRLLLTNSTATTGYSLTAYAAGDVSFSGDIASGSVLQLRNPGLTVVDQVTSSALPAPLSASDDYSYVRRMDGVGGAPLDTNSDTNDFNLVDVQSTTGPNTITGISNGILRLGAPGPENLSSPTTYNSLITLTLASTNRVGAGNSGTLGLRYTLTNKAGSGRTITSLRFRVVAATAGTSNPANPSGAAFAGPADLRLISSTSSDGTILPLLLQQPPTQPGGGGLNSTVSLATLPTGGLAPGASVTVEFLFNVIQRGNYRLLVNLEPLTIAAP